MPLMMMVGIVLFPPTNYSSFLDWLIICVCFSGFLKILGRGKDLVITGGFNVYPKEIEDCIDRLPDVSESAIIGRISLL